ncbi:MAG: hypothetical protein M1823_003613 [Watsoniomyces obsoletus]|nr:MAG: hypothetical protein M1823_003613 [Watsoniomyces obsoletus]
MDPSGGTAKTPNKIEDVDKEDTASIADKENTTSIADKEDTASIADNDSTAGNVNDENSPPNSKASSEIHPVNDSASTAANRGSSADRSNEQQDGQSQDDDWFLETLRGRPGFPTDYLTEYLAREPERSVTNTIVSSILAASAVYAELSAREPSEDPIVRRPTSPARAESPTDLTAGDHVTPVIVADKVDQSPNPAPTTSGNDAPTVVATTPSATTATTTGRRRRRVAPVTTIRRRNPHRKARPKVPEAPITYNAKGWPQVGGLRPKMD